MAEQTVRPHLEDGSFSTTHLLSGLLFSHQQMVVKMSARDSVVGWFPDMFPQNSPTIRTFERSSDGKAHHRLHSIEETDCSGSLTFAGPAPTSVCDGASPRSEDYSFIGGLFTIVLNVVAWLMNLVHSHRLTRPSSHQRVLRLAGIPRWLCVMLALGSSAMEYSNTSIRRIIHRDFGLQSQTLNSCWNTTCSSSYKNISLPQVVCDSGAFVYKYTITSGTSGYRFVSVNQLNMTCSNGKILSVGSTPSTVLNIKQIISASGFNSVQIAPGCIMDHMQIGGVDVGDVSFSGNLSTCNCRGGAVIVGVPSLYYDPDLFPSFASFGILCNDSYICSKGQYNSDDVCTACPSGLKFTLRLNFNHRRTCLGTYSWPGSIGPTSCFGYYPDFSSKEAAFTLAISFNSVTQYVIAYNTTTSIFPVLSATNGTDAIKLHYDNSTLQIRSLALGLCLDDGGLEYLGGQNHSAIITFQPCDAQSSNQQFILNSQRQILNPNWPNNNICFSGNGQFGGLNRLNLWTCANGDSSQIFSVYYLYCPSKSLMYDLINLNQSFSRLFSGRQ